MPCRCGFSLGTFCGPRQWFPYLTFHTPYLPPRQPPPPSACPRVWRAEVCSWSPASAPGATWRNGLSREQKPGTHGGARACYQL